MDTIDKFYQLCEILSDDINKVAFIIKAYHHEQIHYNSILSDCQYSSTSRLEKYAETIETILDLKHSVVIESAKGITFNDLDLYVKYLHLLLESNQIIYAPFVKTCHCKDYLNQRGLFEDE